MFEHLTAQFEITKKKLNLYARIVNIASQVFFIAFYIYNLVTHLNSLYQIIVYSVLLLLILFAFTLEIISYLDDSEKFKTFHLRNKRIIFLIKYLINVGVLIYSFIEYFWLETGDTSNFRLVMLLATATLYILSVVIQLIKDIAITEFSAIYVAAKMDMESNLIGSVLNQFNIDVSKAPRIANEAKIRHNVTSLVNHDSSYYQQQDENKGTRGVLKTGKKILNSLKEYNKKQYSLRLQNVEGLKVEFAKVTPKALATVVNKKKLNKFVADLRKDLDSYPQDAETYIAPILNALDAYLAKEKPNPQEGVKLVAALILISNNKNLGDIRNISNFALNNQL